MKLIFKFILVFNFHFSYAQVDSIKIYFQQSKYEKAITYGENKLKNTRNDSFDYLVLINNMAAVYSFSYKFELSEKYYLIEQSLLIKMFGKNDKTVANNFKSLANV